MKKYIKNKIIVALICSLVLSQSVYAGQFVWIEGKIKYIDDAGNFVTGWRWIDTNSDGIAECYRFDDEGAVMASRSNIKGKQTDFEGKWIVDGAVQQIYVATGKPLYASNAAFGENDTNVYFDIGTLSSTKRINATNKDIKSMMIADMNADEEARKKSLLGPTVDEAENKDKYLYSRGVEKKMEKPIATASNGMVIDKMMQEDEVRYLTASESIVLGKDARKFVSASKKYTDKVDGAKIYGGYVWDDCICLQGNGAYVKINLKDESSGFHANYFKCEVAHQTHGESTSDTYCSLALYLNGSLVTSYDEFCDDEPEVIEEWLNDDESAIELRALITGDAPGRKIYIKNFRLRQVREKNDE